MAVAITLNRRSIGFRELPTAETQPLLGVRCSPSGSYVLLLLKGAPAELWVVSQPVFNFFFLTSFGAAKRPLVLLRNALGASCKAECLSKDYIWAPNQDLLAALKDFRRA